MVEPRAIVMVFVCCLLAVPASGKSRRSRAEEARADSMRVADSLRRVDSVRIADSVTYASYGAAVERNRQGKAEDSARLAAISKPADSAAWASSETDAYSSRQLTISPEKQAIVDSLDKEIALISARLYADKHFKKAKNFSAQDKVGLLRTLLKNGTKKREEVARLAQDLLSTYTLERDKLNVIYQEQEGNDRAFLLRHIRKVNADIQPISEFALRASNQ